MSFRAPMSCCNYTRRPSHYYSRTAAFFQQENARLGPECGTRASSTPVTNAERLPHSSMIVV